MKIERTDRVLPPKFKHIAEFSWLRKFTFRERFWIAIGCPMRIDLNLLTEHGPGKVSPQLTINLAPQQEDPQPQRKESKGQQPAA